MFSEILQAPDLSKAYHPSTMKNLWDLHSHRQDEEGQLVLDDRLLPFLGDSVLFNTNASEGVSPTILFAGSDSLLKKFTGENFIRTNTGLIAPDPKLVKSASDGYLVAREGHMHVDTMHLEINSPLFGIETVTYYRTIVPVVTTSGHKMLLTLTHAIDRLSMLLSQDTQHQISN